MVNGTVAARPVAALVTVLAARIARDLNVRVRHHRGRDRIGGLGDGHQPGDGEEHDE